MKALVTITLDPDCHRLTEQAARERHPSVSGLIESLLQSETARSKGGMVAGTASLISGLSPLTRYRHIARCIPEKALMSLPDPFDR